MLTGLYLVGGLVLLGDGLAKYRSGRTWAGGLSMLLGAVIVAMVVDLWLGLSPLADWMDDRFDDRLS